MFTKNMSSSLMLLFGLDYIHDDNDVGRVFFQAGATQREW